MTKAKRDAFLKGIENGKFNTDKARVYQIIKLSNNLGLKCDIPLIEKRLNKQKNEFTGRITDLLDIGVIREKNNGRYSLFEVVEDKLEQDQLIRKRLTEKIEARLKSLKKLGVKFSYQLPMDF